MVKNTTFNVGDKVFAKVKGYPPWPANIVGDNKNKKYNVVFYGTKETGNIKIEDICYFNQYRDSYVAKYQKRAGYEDAVKEIEAAIKKQGGDGSEKNPDAPTSKLNDSKVNDSVVSDLDTSQSEKPQKTPVAEKKVTKRKVQSLPDEPQVKKTSGRTTRKSTVGTAEDSSEKAESPVDEPEEPAAKKTRKTTSVDEDKVESETKSEESAARETRTKSASSEDKNKVKVEAKVEENGVAKQNGDKADVKESNEVKTKKVKNNKNDAIKLEEPSTTEADKKSTESLEKYEIVSDRELEHVIVYAKHVTNHQRLYEEKPVEPREDHENQVLPVELPSGVLCGLKLHKEWPLKFANEFSRALYDEQVAKSLQELKEQILAVKVKIEDHPDIIVPNLHITPTEATEIIKRKELEVTKTKQDRIRTEANLVSLDGKIKNSLGLDNADPIRALDHLQQFEKVNIDAIMMKKHPHIMDTIRRLRKYVGNIKDWKMTEIQLEEFNSKASKIRSEAEKVYNRLKKTIVVPASKPTFWEGFLELVSEFRSKCTEMDLNEKQVSRLCAEPSSRKAFLDRLDDLENPDKCN